MKKLIALFTLLFICSFACADTWEFAISKQDEADLASGHKRKKAGDIIAVKPYPWTWGRKEVDEYFIVVVSGLTEEQAEALTSPKYDMTVEPDEMGFRPMIGKRRYKLPLDSLKTSLSATKDVDLIRATDKSQTYQPLDDGSAILDISKTNIIIDTIEDKVVNLIGLND